MPRDPRGGAGRSAAAIQKMRIGLGREAGSSLAGLIGNNFGLPQLPVVDASSVLAPFDIAEQQARSAYDAAIPAIEQAQQEVEAEIQRLIADFMAQQQATQQQLAASQQQQTASNAQAAQAATADLAQFSGTLAPSLAADVASQTQQTADLAGNQQTAQLALGQRLGDVGQQSLQGALVGSGLIGQASIGQAGTNLQQILNEIATGRAGATADFEQEQYDREIERFMLERDLRLENEDRNRAAAEGRIAARELEEEEEGAVNAATAQAAARVIAEPVMDQNRDREGNIVRVVPNMRRTIEEVEQERLLFEAEGVDVDLMIEMIRRSMGRAGKARLPKKTRASGRGRDSRPDIATVLRDEATRPRR